MRILVTGGAGFIGHHLVHRLVERGDDVVVIDDFSTGLHWRLDPFRDRIRIIEASILDEEALDVAVASTQVILHQAAIPSVARSVEDPLSSHAANATGTINVMLAATRHGVRRVVLAGSSSVYGPAAELPCRETQRPAPSSPYGVSKLAAEHYLHALGALQGVETVVLRYFNVFGPGQDPASEYAAVIPRFVTAALEGLTPIVFGAGDTSRDFTYVENVVEANLLAADADRLSGLTCNIACGDRFSLLELLQTISGEVGRRIEPAFGPRRAGDILHSQADISLARDTLGYEPVVSFGEGISRTVAWYRARTADEVASSRRPRVDGSG
jgi:UDP-glucose 4-epimerase